MDHAPHDHHGHAHHHTGGAPGAPVVRDPVCGMTVDPDKGKPTYELEGHTYHFCCEGCRNKFAADPQAYMTATDPVCGMSVDRATARYFLKHEGRKYYFCSAGCMEKFEADADSYLAGDAQPEPMPEGTKYTCPMHPEIVQIGPGDCPKCGMALEPMGVPAAGEGPNPELVDFTRRFWISVACALPLLILTMGAMVGLPFRAWIGERVSTWLELILATPVVLWAAIPFFKRGWASILNRSPNMWTLIAIGVGSAYGFSVVATLVPFAFPPALSGLSMKGYNSTVTQPS